MEVFLQLSLFIQDEYSVDQCPDCFKRSQRQADIYFCFPDAFGCRNVPAGEILSVIYIQPTCRSTYQKTVFSPRHNQFNFIIGEDLTALDEMKFAVFNLVKSLVYYVDEKPVTGFHQ